MKSSARTDYFTFFDLPVAPTVDQSELKRRFYANSRKFHPDFYTLEGEERQAEVLEMSTFNNEAYQTLRDDETRLKYLLELKGALAEEGKNQVPQDFLLEIMDINEALMELEFDEDPALREKASNLTAELSGKLENEVRPLLEKYDDEKVTESELNGLRDYYLKKRYLLRIFEKIKAD